MRNRVAGWLVMAACMLRLSDSASSQCMQWDSSYSITILPGGTYTTALASIDLGPGPVLHTNVDGRIYRRIGTTWQLEAPELDDGVQALCGYDDGSGMALYAGGFFLHDSQSGVSIRGVAKLVGWSWQVLGNGLPVASTYNLVRALYPFDDGGGPQLYVGGAFDTSQPFQSDSLLRWDGSNWTEVGSGIAWDASGGGSVYAMRAYNDGSGSALYVAGAFHLAGGLPANNIAKWDGTTWSALGSGIEGAPPPALYPYVQALAVYDDGTGPALYVGGLFLTAGGVPSNGLAKWNGTNWSAVPGFDLGGGNSVSALAVHTDASGPALYVSQDWSLLAPKPQRWDGSTWSNLGAGIPAIGQIRSMVSFDDGLGAGPALVVAGTFDQAGGNLVSHHVARWLSCTRPIEQMCPGDGSLAVCPCGNYGASLHGCANSTSASGALLAHSGTTNPDTLSLISSAEPSSSLSMFLQSSSLRPAQIAFGDGILCLGGQLRRMYLGSAVNGTAIAPQPGHPSITQRSAALGDPIPPGSVRYYQVWYRDGVANFCTQSPGSTFNVSNGLRVVW